MQLSDLKVIVTGGAQGMGAHFAKRLAEAGIDRKHAEAHAPRRSRREGRGG